MFAELVSLFFPNNCAGCTEPLKRNEVQICLSCQFKLPYTRFHSDPENQVQKLFWGKVQLEAATSLVFFRKDTRIQEMMHQLKYKGRTGVGERLGLWLGQELASTESFQEVTAIIPVPLHQKKLRKRGYNQSEFIAKGVSTALKVPVDSTSLIRVKHSSTQTKKSKFERFENVNSIFQVRNEAALQGQHVLLVDDVVTTGSTLEACAQQLLHIEGVKVSIATIACA